MKFFVAAVLLSVGGCAASYPTAYPFENESLVPPVPRAATPSFTFDDTDNGGYIYTFAYSFDVTDADMPFCYALNGFWSHQYVVRSSISPTTPLSDHNCTAKDNLLGSYSYFGTVADVKICTEGECCEKYWGTPTFWGAGSPYLPYYDDIGKVYEDGACEEMFGEDVYCVIMSAGQNWACIEQYVTPSERLVVYPCYDSFYNHYSACKLYQVSGFMFRPSTEPTAYVEESTAAEVNALNGLYFCPDRVCQPYSYFFPEFKKSESAGSDSGSEASSTESSDESEESPASALATVFFAVAALLC